jgi:multidrug efflux system outer membrane protein
MRPPVTLFVIPSLLAACVSLPPEEKPALTVDVPPAWTAAPTLPGLQAAEDAWWTAFGDQNLDSLIVEALSNNQDLQMAAARVEAAAAQARIAGAPRYPWVNAGLTGARAKRNFIGFPIPGSEERVLSTTSTNLGLSAEVSWEADLWGRIRAGKRATLWDYQATQADYAAAQLSLTALIARSWFGVIEARQQVALSRDTLESRRLTAERVRERYRRGLAVPLDLRLSLTQLELADATLQARRRLLDSALRQLEVVLGRYPGARLEAALDLPPVPPRVPTGLPSELVTRRPDLVAAELRVGAAGARVLEARRALYPRLTLTGSSGTASAELEDLLDGDFSVWSLAAGILQPLFQGGRLRAAVDLAQSGNQAALADYVSSVLEAFAEVESALAAEAHLAEEVRALERAVEQSQAALRLAQDRYSAGLARYLAVLESQRQSFVSESQLLATRRNRLNARVDLILALGGDFQ